MALDAVRPLDALCGEGRNRWRCRRCLVYKLRMACADAVITASEGGDYRFGCRLVRRVGRDRARACRTLFFARRAFYAANTDKTIRANNNFDMAHVPRRIGSGLP